MKANQVQLFCISIQKATIEYPTDCTKLDW